MTHKALILGGAECVWKDAEAALQLFKPDGVFAINDMIAEWPGKLTHAITLHTEKLDAWMDRRLEHGHPIGFEIWSDRPNMYIRNKVYSFVADWGGSSSLHAVEVARVLSFDRIVLCGVPMELDAGHFIRHKPWDAVGLYWEPWKNHQPELAAFVRSMSGRTKGLFGAPTAEWLNG